MQFLRRWGWIDLPLALGFLFFLKLWLQRGREGFAIEFGERFAQL